MERRRLGYRVDRFSEERSDPIIPDPPAYLERQLATCLAEIEACARRCEIPKDRAELFLKLLRFTSLVRTRAHVHGHLEKLLPEPDLSRLTTEQLERILRGETIDVELSAERDDRETLDRTNR